MEGAGRCWELQKPTDASDALCLTWRASVEVMLAAHSEVALGRRVMCHRTHSEKWVCRLLGDPVLVPSMLSTRRCAEGTHGEVTDPACLEPSVRSSAPATPPAYSLPIQTPSNPRHRTTADGPGPVVLPGSLHPSQKEPPPPHLRHAIFQGALGVGEPGRRLTQKFNVDGGSPGEITPTRESVDVNFPPRFMIYVNDHVVSTQRNRPSSTLRRP